ncbi:4-diphosphocytidyl-2-C-methyl-D-erythritol kinase [Candidatus Xenohaliotis californiensis]|uniref:4-diphosphocytidyl-2-C-methyl-D-erythritol kinase n=1 Tax=Candidatus Xenohaliotis californiensis TaxID=84677 RepID=A0ABP0EVY4_9RICK|nr:4-diphosphocytidyl-2-C-methyl-D-erythritol kinase [Candidatus Xenohaliotis californiensis]
MNAIIQGKAYSKVNLFLNIVGKREDGYHLLESLMVFADLSDSIMIAKADKFTVKYTGSSKSDIVVGEDTVSKAVQELSKYFDCNFKVAIQVEKNIPVGAGLGGGSADAALVLRMLIKLYKLGINNNALYKIAKKIGCDVPICLENHACLVKGVGEVLLSVPYFNNIPAIFINPMKFLGAGDVFKNRTGDFSKSSIFKRSSIMENFLTFKNDLYDSAVSLVPEIAEIIHAIRAQKGCRLGAMSGSGATCFGLFNSVLLRDKAYKALQVMFKNYFVARTSITHKGDTDFMTRELDVNFCL